MSRFTIYRTDRDPTNKDQRLQQYHGFQINSLARFSRVFRSRTDDLDIDAIDNGLEPSRPKIGGLRFG
jgi:hypothetical protein